MIFITLGSQKFQFNRLLQAIDDLVGKGDITEPVFAQIGHSDYVPLHFQYEKFMDRNEFSQKIAESDIVITHGGTGVIINAVKAGKKVIAVPRRAKYGEHVDDHQLQIIEQFKELNLICDCNECEELGDLVKQIRNVRFGSYVSNTQTIIDDIEQYLETEFNGDIGGR